MTDGKKTQDAKKKGDVKVTAQVSAPLIPLQSETLFASAKKEDVVAAKKDEQKKDDSKKDAPAKDGAKKEDVKKDDAKKDEVKIQTGPTLEELTLRTEPTLLEKQAKEVNAKNELLTGKDKKTTVEAKKEEPKAVPDAATLEEIARQQQLLQQPRVGQPVYTLELKSGPQAMYHPNSQSTGLTSVYHPANAATAYIPNAQRDEELPQRGGRAATQYERADLVRVVGKTVADELLDRANDKITGDKGIASMYNKNRNI